MRIGAGVPVAAAGETPRVGAPDQDAADDPEIWVDPEHLDRGVILGTHKQAGLYVYDLRGVEQQFLALGKVNNVDLRDGFMVDGRRQVLIAASNRSARSISLLLLDPETRRVGVWGEAAARVSEAYGFCLGRRGGDFIAVLVGIDGDVTQHRIEAVGGKPVVTEERSFAVGSQAEGCVVDDMAGSIYVGEEARGIWRYSLDPAAGPVRTLIAAAPSDQLKPDVEGLTLLREGAKTWLIASSQGDSAFAVWRVDGAAPAYAGRFSVTAGAGADAVTGTDGLAAASGQAGAFPEGLVVVQDDADSDGETDEPKRIGQNFKLVDWRAIKAALGL